VSVEGTRLGRPRVQTAGQTVGSPGQVSNVDGHQIVPTWTSVSGSLECGDINRDGYPDIVVRNAASLGSDWTPSGSVEADLTSPSPQGAVARFGRPAVNTLLNNRFELAAERPGTTADVWDVTVSEGSGSCTIDVHALDPGEGATWTVRKNGATTGTATGTGTGGTQFNGPPRLYEFVGDSDGDGIPDLRCANFPPNTVCTIAGVSHPCDEVIIHPTGLAPVTRLSSIRMTPSGLVLGDGGLTNLLMAEFATVPVASVPPVGVPQAALAVWSPVPNPSFRAASLRFAIARAGDVKATVLDVAGRSVATLANGRFDAGEHALTWSGRTGDGHEAAAGVYFVRVEHEGADARTVRLTHMR